MLLYHISRLESSSYNFALTHVQSPGELACLFSLCSRVMSVSPQTVCTLSETNLPITPFTPRLFLLGSCPSGSAIANDFLQEMPLSYALVLPLFSHISTTYSLPAPGPPSQTTFLTSASPGFAASPGWIARATAKVLRGCLAWWPLSGSPA